MATFTKTIDIQAPPQRVWEIMSDVERWHEWTPSITSIERLDRGSFQVGSRARVRQPKLRPAVWQVTELEKDRSFTWVTRSPGIRVTGRHEVEPFAGGSRATLSVEFSGLLAPLVAWLTRGLNQRYLGMEANGLKSRSEAKSEAARRRA